MLDEAAAACAGLDPSVWVSPASLHLTVVMLKLYSGEARRLACEASPPQCPDRCSLQLCGSPPSRCNGQSQRRDCSDRLVCLPHGGRHDCTVLVYVRSLIVRMRQRDDNQRPASCFPFAPLHLISSVCEQVLQAVQDEVQALRGERPLRVSVRGLRLMKGDPAAAHVLYAGIRGALPEPDPDGNSDQGRDAGASVDTLQRICAVVMRAFAAAGLVPQHDVRCGECILFDTQLCVPSVMHRLCAVMTLN